MFVNCPELIPLFGFERATGYDWLKSLIYGVVIVISMHGTNAFGSYITMVTDFSVTASAEELTVAVKAENRGDEAAHDVQFEIIINGRVLVGPGEEILEQASKMSAEFTLTDMVGVPGRYPVVARTYYKDASGHRFTALTVGYYDYIATSTPTVSISSQAIDIPVDGKGQVVFALHNDSQSEQKIDLALFIPNELSVPREHTVIELGPQQETTVVFDVENYSALANSSYLISLVGQYESAGSHFCIVESTTLRVTGEVEPTVRLVWIWVLLGALIPGMMVLLWLKKVPGM